MVWAWETKSLRIILNTHLSTQLKRRWSRRQTSIWTKKRLKDWRDGDVCESAVDVSGVHGYQSKQGWTANAFCAKSTEHVNTFLTQKSRAAQLN